MLVARLVKDQNYSQLNFYFGGQDFIPQYHQSEAMKAEGLDLSVKYRQNQISIFF